MCRQVFDALTYAPSAARVLVTLAPSHDGLDLGDALARLNEAAPDLREEVAAEVSRRRVPELTFRIESPVGT